MADVTKLDIDIEASAASAAEALDDVVSGLDDAARSLKSLAATAKSMGLDRASKQIESIAKAAGLTQNLNKANEQLAQMADNYEKVGQSMIAGMLRNNSNLLEVEKRLRDEETAAKKAAAEEKRLNSEAAASKRAAEREKRFAALQTHREHTLLLRKQANEITAANRAATLEEKTRHNKESELISRVKAEYADKAKTATLKQQEMSLAERVRHNKAMEELRSEALAEKKAADETRKRTSAIRETGNAIAKVLGSIGKGSGITKSISKAFDKLTKKAKTAFASIGKSLKDLFSFGGGKTNALSKFIKAIGRIALYRAIRSMIKAITQGFAEGIKNLYAYSELIGTKFKPSMDKMATAALFVKNAFAAMAAPLINTVAPIIDIIGDKVAALANKIAEFLSALTGQNVYTKAIKYAKAYNDELDKTAKKLERWLAPFDEINRMNDNSGSGAEDAIDYSKMFEEAVVSAEMSELARRIIEAFNNADLSPIGKALAEKLKAALDSLKWDEIKAKAERIAKTITSFINGGLSVKDLGKTIGTTIAEAFNTALTFAGTLISTLHWKDLGKQFGDAIRAFISTFKFEDVGTSINNLATGLLDALEAAVESLSKIDPATGLSGWDELGKRIADSIANIKFGTLLSKTVAVGMSIVKGILGSVVAFLKQTENNGFWDELGSGVGEALANVKWAELIGKVIKIGTGIVKGIFTAVKSALKSGLGVDDETASFIVDALAVGLLATKVAKLFGKTKALTGGFQDKNQSLSQQTELTQAETAAATDLSSVFGKQSSTVVPGLVGALGIAIASIFNLKNKTQEASGVITASFTGAMNSVQAKSNETANALNPLNNTLISTIPNSVAIMDNALNRHISSAQTTLSGFCNSINAIPESMKSMVDNTKENLEITAKNEESYMKTEGKNWQAFQQHRADAAAASARSVQKVEAALKNNWAIPAAAVIAAVAIGALGALSGGTTRNSNRGLASAQMGQYANGGYPSAGSLFIAGEGGRSPEYVGSFGGQTGVWNSDQLVNAMYRAVSQALANNPQGGGGDIYLDGEKIYTAVVRRNNNHVRSTGRAALLT